MDKDFLEKLTCPACGGSNLRVESAGSATAGKIPSSSLVCDDCNGSFAVVDNILDTTPGGDSQLAVWESVYRNAPELERSFHVSNLLKGLENRKLLKSYYPIIRMVERLPLPLESSLELGSGSGFYSLLIKKLGMVRDVTLLDYSREANETARRLFDYFGESCNIVCANLEKPPFKKGSFDLAISGGVIEHYRTMEERLHCLDVHLDTARWAYVQAPANSLCYWAQRLAITIIKRGWPFGFERPVTEKEMRKLVDLAKARITDLDYQYFFNILVFLLPQLVRVRHIAEKGWGFRCLRTDVSIMATR